MITSPITSVDISASSSSLTNSLHWQPRRTCPRLTPLAASAFIANGRRTNKAKSSVSTLPTWRNLSNSRRGNSISSTLRRREKADLGGVPVTSSQASILERVHAQRVAAENKGWTDSAIRIQAWYRRMREARAEGSWKEVEKVVRGRRLKLDGMPRAYWQRRQRAIYLGIKWFSNGNCWTRLLTIAALIFLYSPGQVLALASGQKLYWRVLVPQARLLLLQSTAVNPLWVYRKFFFSGVAYFTCRSPKAQCITFNRFRILLTLKDRLWFKSLLITLSGMDSTTFWGAVSRLFPMPTDNLRPFVPSLLNRRGLLPLLFHLAVRPLATFPMPTPQYSECLVGIFVHLLTAWRPVTICCFLTSHQFWNPGATYNSHRRGDECGEKD